MKQAISEPCLRAQELLDNILTSVSQHPKYNFNLNNVELVSTSVYEKQHKRVNYISLSPTSKAILRIFERVFAVWEAGANKRKLFNEIYAFPPHSEEYSHLEGKNLFELDYDELAPVNLSKKHADHFMTCLVAQAKNVRCISGSLAAANRSRFFLIGDVGSGKTTFLNYIFSRHYDTLKRKKVMWIRIDLTKTYHGVESLNDALLFQLSRIVRKSYFDGEFENDPEFESTIRDQFKKLIAHGKYTEKSVDEYIAEYFAPYDRERTEPFHFLVQKGVQRYVQKRFSMIFIYDGLDRLRRGADFEEKLKEIQKHILGSEKRKHIYIFVMRTTSHARSLNKYLTSEEHTLAALRKVSKTFTIIAPKLSDVVERRLRVLSNIWDRLLYEERHRILITDINDIEEDVDIDELQKVMNACRWLGDFNILQSYYSIFLRFIYRGLSLSGKDDSLTVDNIKFRAYHSLKNVVGENFRILLSVLNHLQKCFLEVIEELKIDRDAIVNMANMLEQKRGRWSNRDLMRLLAKHYRVVRTLLRNRNYYVHPFRYYRGNDGKLAVDLDNSVPFIFNIFRGANIPRHKGECYHLLAKTRILQFLDLENQQSRGYIIDYISRCFGYNKEYLSCDLNELMTMGLVNRTPKNNEYGEIYYEYQVTRSGKHLLYTLMFELSYLEIVIDDILVPIKFLDDFGSVSNKKNYDNLVNRLRNFYYIINFLMLISSLEKQEKKKFTMNNKTGLNFDDTFSITSKFSNSLMSTFGKMLSGKEESICKNAFRIINNLSQQVAAGDAK